MTLIEFKSLICGTGCLSFHTAQANACRFLLYRDFWVVRLRKLVMHNVKCLSMLFYERQSSRAYRNQTILLEIIDLLH